MKKIVYTISLIFTFSSAIFSQIPTDGLVAYYPFNGNANDESGNGNDGTVNGATLTTDRFGIENESYYFNGSGDYIEIANNAALNLDSLSISCWIKKDGDGAGLFDGIVSKSNGGIQGYLMAMTHSDNVGFWIRNNTGDNFRAIQSNDLVKINDWYHLTSIFSNGAMKLYVNGILQTQTVSDALLANNSNPLTIGLYNAGTSEINHSYFNGTIDDVRIYNRALTETEIQKLYEEGGWSSLNQGLVAYYPFNGNADDESLNGNDGTVNGATLTTDRFGKPNSAYNFDENQEIIIPDSEDKNTYPLTISLWYNADTVYLNENSNLFSKYVAASWNGYAILLSDNSNIGNNDETYNFGDGVPSWYLRSMNDRVIGYYGEEPFLQKFIDKKIWCNYVFTVDDSGGKIYVDGELIESHAWTGESGNCSNSFLWKIGGFYTNWYHGKIDDIRIYNRALDSTEIESLYYENYCFETIYDTITTEVYDTTFITVYDTIPVYDSISVTDTLIIDAVLTGIDPPDNVNTLKIYPNPAKDHIFINTGDYTKMIGYQLKIIDQLGSVVFETNVEQALYEVNLSTWSGTGLYFVQVIDSGGKIIDIRKIILQ